MDTGGTIEFDLVMSNRIKQHLRCSSRADLRPSGLASHGGDAPVDPRDATNRERWFGAGLLGSAGALVATATAPLLAGQAHAVWHAPGVRTVDEVLGALVLAVGGAGAAWLAVWAAVAAGALLTAGVRGTAAPVHRLTACRGTPRLVRRALTGALGLSLLAGGAPAMASTDGGPADLGWDAAAARTVAAADVASAGGMGAGQPSGAPQTPATVTQTGTPAPSDPAARDRAEAASTPEPHVVARGESLWSIAATHLGPGTTDREVAAAWPRWYEANRAAVGDDPDHITPGLVLAPPAAQPTTGG